MKQFFEYLKKNTAICVFFIIACGIFAISFFLYRLPVQAAAYPAALCALLGIFALLFGFFKNRSRRRTLQKLLLSDEISADDLPEPRNAEQREFSEIIKRLCREKQEIAAEAADRYSDMIDYYTLWAHQIKTPISAMRLRLQAQDSAEARSLLRELSRIERYVEMVLCYLRLDSDTTDYVFREYELDAIIRESVKKFSGEFISRGIALDLKPTGIKVVTDEKWLGFVIEQLISNALKYTNEGSITIEALPGDRLCIKDTGIGISEEDLPRIFEKGYTGLNGRTDKRASGIGLYLCRRICKNLKHSITAYSKLGEGTAVIIGLYRDKTVM